MTTAEADHTGRLARCRALLDERGLDAVLVTDRYDVRYLSGFRGEDATLVVGADAALIVTDSRFYEQVHEEVAAYELVEHRGTDLLEDSVKAAAERVGEGIALGYQAGAMTHAEFRGLRRAHRGRLRDVRRHVTRLRMVKEPAEVEAIAAAAALVDLALGVVVGEGLVGRTETEVAWRLLEEYHARGAEGESFEAIVAAGDHGAQGHAIPGERRIKAGELVVIDTGARVDGYCSDITRTFAAGRASKAQPQALRHRPRGAARRGGGRAARRARPRPRRRGRPRRRSRRPATASSSATARGTASGSRCTRRRSSAACAATGSRPAWSARSSPASTSRARWACASRTPCSSPVRAASA